MAAPLVGPMTQRRTWWDRGLDILFPPRCIGCGRRGVDVCSDCLADVQPLGPRICPRCSQPSIEGRVCPACRRRPRTARAILAGFPFEGVIRAAILALKYRSQTRLADFLGSALLLPLQTRPLEVDVIVPVPLWLARRRERGFNQSEMLARRVAQAYGWPVDPTALVRLRDTPPQSELPARQRWANVSGAFAVGPQGDVRGRRILLVDDVCTTGATIEACAAPLVQAGAAGVWALVVARSVPPGPEKAGPGKAR